MSKDFGEIRDEQVEAFLKALQNGHDGQGLTIRDPRETENDDKRQAAPRTVEIRVPEIHAQGTRRYVVLENGNRLPFVHWLLWESMKLMIELDTALDELSQFHELVGDIANAKPLGIPVKEFMAYAGYPSIE